MATGRVPSNPLGMASGSSQPGIADSIPTTARCLISVGWTAGYGVRHPMTRFDRLWEPLAVLIVVVIVWFGTR